MSRLDEHNFRCADECYICNGSLIKQTIQLEIIVIEQVCIEELHIHNVRLIILEIYIYQ